MAETVQRVWGSLSLALPKVCALPQFSISKSSSPSVKWKLISCRCIADLDSGALFVWCASRQSVPLPYFFLGPLTSKKLKERKHPAVSSAFCEHSVLSLRLSHHQHLKVHHVSYEDFKWLAILFAYCLRREAFNCHWNAATSAVWHVFIMHRNTIQQLQVESKLLAITAGGFK